MIPSTRGSNPRRSGDEPDEATNIKQYNKMDNVVITEKDFSKLKNIPGIYMFRNIVNNKKYIGQSINLYKRLSEHLWKIKNGTYNTHVLYKAVRKYGIDNFEIIILTTFPPHDQLRKNLNLSEKIYIQFYDSYNNGYNCTLGGDGTVGVKWSDDRKEKFRKYLKTHKIIRKNNPKSKRVYLYNFEEKYYSDYESCAKASKSIGLNSNAVSECARGKNKRAGSFICAYSPQELSVKISEFKQFLLTNKYRSISPDYEYYFIWLVKHADQNGIIPIAKEIAKTFNINNTSIADWNSHIKDRIEKVRIGNRDRIKIKNYDEIKNKAIE